MKKLLLPFLILCSTNPIISENIEDQRTFSTFIQRGCSSENRDSKWWDRALYFLASHKELVPSDYDMAKIGRFRDYLKKHPIMQYGHFSLYYIKAKKLVDLCDARRKAIIDIPSKENQDIKTEKLVCNHSCDIHCPHKQ